MLKLNAVSCATLVALLGFVNVADTKNLPNSYKVIDLGALEKVEVNGDAGIIKSFGFALNNNGIAVGASEGAYTYDQITRDENNNPTGTEEVDTNVFQAIVFDTLSSSFQSIIPQNHTFGFGLANNKGMYALDVTENGAVVGYGVTRDTESEFNVDCNTIDDTDCREYVRAFYYEGNQLNFINSSVRYGLELDQSITEFTNTRAFGANTEWVVGYLSRVTAKTNTGTEDEPYYSVTSSVNRAFMFNRQSQQMITLSPQESDDLTSESRLYAVNEAGTFVGFAQVINDSDNRETRAIYGTVGSDSFTEVAALEGSTFAQFWNINPNGTYAVGSSNSSESLSSQQAFYYDFASGQSIGMGYLNESILSSQAFAVNDDNLVVGISLISVTPNVYRPFVYDIDDSNAKMIDLNSMIECNSGWTLTEVRDINSDGFIIGTGTITVTNSDGSKTGEIHAVLLEPSDEVVDSSQCEAPTEDTSGGTMGLFTGLLTLLGLSRRFSRKSKLCR
jgi:hypothetical protein